jgi:hypothetical protein
MTVARLIKGARDAFCPGPRLGSTTTTHPDQIKADLLAFLRG